MATRPVVKSQPTSPADLAHVTQEMYKQNLELVERNKTLALLRKIDEVVLSAVTDPKAVAEKISKTIIAETEFHYVSVLLINDRHTQLAPVAVAFKSQGKGMDEDIAHQMLSNHIPLTDGASAAVTAWNHHKKQTSTSLAKLRGKHFERSSADRIQKVLGVANFFICPLEVRGEVIGVLVIGTREVVTDLSDFQKTLVDRLTGVVGIALDNAMLYEKTQEATARLRQANRHLKELDKAKDEFISMASHQLRTPLTTIKGYLSMLLEGDAGKIKPEQKDYIDFAFGGAERMVALISDLLNVSRLSAGRFMIETKPTDLTAVVEDEVRQLQTHAQAKKLLLTFETPKKKIPEASLDEGKTRQVIMNFIDNAIYYTREGSVAVSLKQVGSELELRVKDTGIGVPEEAQKKLFTKFFRADNAQTVRPDGTGLGLYLAKRVVEDQGGTIIFETELGKGSTFGFRLPLHVHVKGKAS